MRALCCALATVGALVALCSPAVAKVATFARAGTGPGQLHDPTDVAVDAQGNLLVAEKGNARVQKFSPSGAALLTFGGFGTGESHLGDGTSLVDVAVGADGDYYVLAGATGEIKRYEPDGSFVARWQHGAGGGTGLAALANGDLYVLAGDRVVRMTTTGVLVGTWTVRNASGTAVSGIDIAGRGDRLYVLVGQSYESKYIVGYDGVGTEVARWAGPSTEFGGPGSLYGVMGIGTDATGNVLAVGNGGLVRFDGQGNFLDAFGPGSVRFPGGVPNDQCGTYLSAAPPGTGLPAPLDVAGDAAGNIWLTQQGSMLSRVDQEPNVYLDWGPYVGSQRLNPGTLLRLDASASNVSFGSVKRFEWDLDGDGTFERDTGSTGSIVFTYDDPGSHTATVRVTGGSGLTSTRSHTFELEVWRMWFNTSPALQGGAAALMAPFAAACSPLVRFEWDVDGDGTFERDTGTKNAIDLSFPQAGTIRVGVRITREGGRQDAFFDDQEVYPAAPRGPRGITINGGSQYTNTPEVSVEPTWPNFAGHVELSDDGGFKRSRKFALGLSIPWQLPTAGSTRLPRVVYARFGGGPFPNRYSDSATTYQDDIILDQTRPVVTSATTLDAGLAAAAAVRHRLRIRARDNMSGVRRMQVTPSRRRPGPWRKFRRSTAIRTDAAKVFVRVRDGARNASRWRVVRL